MSNITVDTLDLLSATYLTQRFQNAAATLITYDFILNLPREVNLVWFGKWAVPSIIFMINRYGVLFYTLASTIQMDYGLNIMSPTELAESGFLTTFFCEFWNTLGSWSIPVMTLLVEAVLVKRVSALCGQVRAVVIPLWTLYACCAMASFALMVLEIHDTMIMSTTSSGAGCDLKASTRITWALWVPPLVMESTLVIVTGFRSFQYSWNDVSFPLLTVLTRDGFMYFFCVFALMLANLMICLTPSFLYYSLLVEMTLGLVSILGSRLFLNLRESASEEQRRRSAPQSLSFTSF